MRKIWFFEFFGQRTGLFCNGDNMDRRRHIRETTSNFNEENWIGGGEDNGSQRYQLVVRVSGPSSNIIVDLCSI